MEASEVMIGMDACQASKIVVEEITDLENRSVPYNQNCQGQTKCKVKGGNDPSCKQKICARCRGCGDEAQSQAKMVTVQVPV